MNQAIKNDFIQNARKEIDQRIEQTDLLCTQIANSYSEYTDHPFSQYAAVAVMSLMMVALILFSSDLVQAVLARAEQNFSREFVPFVYATLIGLGIYIALSALKIMIRLNHISLIKSHVNRLTSIKKYLKINQDDLDQFIAKIEKTIAEKRNIQIQPATNIDNELDYFRKIANTYESPNGQFLNSMIPIAYWISSGLFGATFVALTASTMAEGISRMFGTNMNNFIVLVYAVLALAGFITLNVFLHKQENDYGMGNFLASLICGPVAMPALVLLAGVVYLVVYAILIVLIVGVIIAVLAAIFGGSS